MKDQSLWTEALTHLSKHIEQPDVDKWLKPLILSETSASYITLVAPNKFLKSWVDDKYITIIKKVLNDEFSITSEVRIILNSSGSKVRQISVTQHPEQPLQHQVGMQLDKDFTFDKFVAGDSNKFAYASCRAISSGDLSYNPLYIYGEIGLGKTHLMQAVGNELIEKSPKLHVLYTTAEIFVNEFIKSMRTNNIDDFKESYRNVDVLLFDDVQFLAGKEKSMEEFFYTFNQLYAAKKKIILTSDTAPADIKGMEKRLSSRFSSGLMADIKWPSVEEKEAIISKFLELQDVKLSNEVIHYIAVNIKTQSVRELKGVVLRLVTIAEMNNEAVTIELAAEKLKEFLQVRDKALSPDDILNISATYFNLKPIDLKSKNRSKNLSHIRSIIMYLLRQKTALSLADIGGIFGRDHSTALHSINKVGAALENDDDITLKTYIEDINKKFKMSN